MTSRPVVLTLILLAGLARPATAQTGGGAVVTGLVGVAAARSATGVDVSGSVRYRFNRVIGFELEVAMIDRLESDAGYYDSPYARIDRPGTRVTLFTNNVRLEIPTTSSRVIPYIVAGGGIGTIRERSNVIYFLPPITALDAGLAAILNTQEFALGTAILPGPAVSFQNTTAMALMLGGGAQFLVARHLSLDLDLRHVTLMGDQPFGVGRFGGGVSYRF